MDTPGSKSARTSSSYSGSKSASSFLFSKPQSEIENQEILQLIKSQNKTTHAVRAIAVFLLGNLIWSLLATVFFVGAILLPRDTNCNFYSCDQSASGFAIFLFVIGVLVSIAGFAFTLVASISELRSSRLEKTPI
jgi:hypothetical protein